MTRIVSGLAGGALGCALMSVFLRRMHRTLPREDQYALPPRRIAMALAEKAGIGAPRRERARRALTNAAHYAYGTSLGAVYAAIVPRTRTRWAAVAGGVPFALAVWSGSYLGWLPAVGLHPPATQESAPRNALMIGAHVVWAGTIALAVAALGDRQIEPTHEESATDLEVWLRRASEMMH